MKTRFKTYLNEGVKDPFRSHKLRINKKYKPKYRIGLIAIRFQNRESGKDVNNDGKYIVDYQDLFNNRKSDFLKYFENKYKIQLSNYRSGSDDYYHYFKCEPGKEEQKLEEISKDEIVKDVDFVDVRNLESKDELKSIIEELIDIESEFSEYSDDEIDNIISDIIKRLSKL